MDEAFEIDPIVTKYVRSEPLTMLEETRLQEWIAGGEGRAELLERLRNDPEWTKRNLIRMHDLPHERIWEKIEAKLKSEGVWIEKDSATPPNNRRSGAPVVPFEAASRSEFTEGLAPHRPNWLRYGVAAAVLLAVAGITYLIRSYHKDANPAVVTITPAKLTDIQPGGNKATLTLADGKTVDLDSAADGVLTSQGNTYVAKANGKLAYNIAASEKPTEPTYNVLATPRAGQFTLALPDGTQVWLNNASSIRYPVWFTGATREVELTGEAYFEVAKDATHPFRVHIRNSAAGPNGGTIEVLGTSFNIMAYSDENAERATLVDGSIRYVHEASTHNASPNNISAHNISSVVLKPSDEAVFTANTGNSAGELKTLHNVNVDEITAWKNGYFHFDRSSLETTMRQLARWYDVTVVYQGNIAPQEFNGKIQRSMTLSTVLKGIEGENVHFKLEGKQVIVTP